MTIKNPLSSQQLVDKLHEILKVSTSNPIKAQNSLYDITEQMLQQFGYDDGAELVDDIQKSINKHSNQVRKKNKGSGKQKGASFERTICTQLSLWVSSGERKDIFWRSAMSGGRATIAFARGESLANQSSDITAVDRLGRLLTLVFSIECKFYQDLNVPSIIFGSKSGIINFWEQTIRDSRKFQKKPMLIAKQNMKPEILVLDSDGVSYFSERCGSNLPVLVVQIPYNMHMMLFNDFLEFVDPEVIEVGKIKSARKKINE